MNRTAPFQERSDRGAWARRTTIPAELPKGIADIRPLPDAAFRDLWDSILVADQIKDQLLAQTVLNFTVRTKVARTILPLHGIILLVGPPGTGKTSLAKGVAARTAEALCARDGFWFLEVDPHALSSASLGRSQRAVTDLFRDTIAEYAAEGPTIILLDEVETLLVDRSKLSLEANPIDVHRATDAALVQLDYLAEQHPNLLFVATSNFPEAIDSAFVSRADLVLHVPVPDVAGCRQILTSTIEGLAVTFPEIERVLQSPRLEEVVHLCVGLDGRRIRKLVAAACTLDKQTAIDPNRLGIEDLLTAAKGVREEATQAARRMP